MIPKLNFTSIKLKKFKNVFKEICDKFHRAKELINKKIEKICSQEKFSVQEISYFFEDLCF